MEDISIRINQIADFYNVKTPAKFAKATGLSHQVATNYLKGDRNPNLDGLLKIKQSFNINTEWLLSGEGNMIKEITKCETRPRIPMSALAGSITYNQQGVTCADCEYIPMIKTLPEYDFTIIAKGDSMQPRYYSGDELACKYLNTPTFIQWGRPHVLDTTQGILVKIIYDDGNFIACESVNHEKYPKFRIPKDEIRSISLVVGVIREE